MNEPHGYFGFVHPQALEALGAPRARAEAAFGCCRHELSRVANSLVEAIAAFGPELDAVAPEPVATPERRPRHRTRGLVPGLLRAARRVVPGLRRGAAFELILPLASRVRSPA